MKTSDGIILWTLGAAGTLLVYSAYKNVKPQSVLMHYFTGAAYTSADAIQPNRPSGDNKTSGDPLLGPHDPANTPLLPGQTPDTGSKQLYTDKGLPLANYNTRGTDPTTMPAAYQNSPGTYIPAKAMTA